MAQESTGRILVALVAATALFACGDKRKREALEQWDDQRFCRGVLTDLVHKSETPELIHFTKQSVTSWGASVRFCALESDRRSVDELLGSMWKAAPLCRDPKSDQSVQRAGVARLVEYVRRGWRSRKGQEDRGQLCKSVLKLLKDGRRSIQKPTAPSRLLSGAGARLLASIYFCLRDDQTNKTDQAVRLLLSNLPSCALPGRNVNRSNPDEERTALDRLIQRMQAEWK